MTEPSSSKRDVSSSPNTVVYLPVFLVVLQIATWDFSPWSADLGLSAKTLDLVLYSVKRQIGPEKLKHIFGKIVWYIGLKIEQIQVQLVVDHTAWPSRE